MTERKGTIDRVTAETQISVSIARTTLSIVRIA